MTTEARRRRNQDLLRQLDPVFANRIWTLLQDLTQLGERPRLQDAWRDPKEQRRLKQAGLSEVSWSFHNACRGPTPSALAVHVLDDRHPLNPSPRYLIRLAHHAHGLRLQTGILWGLRGTIREATEAAVLTGNLDFRGKMGWDPLHVEPRDLTLADAKRGVVLRA
jgi:peptidoglycan L-alanyl-D-glutamate endopeptidase CwlK